jgi:serine/threonine protein phosphatase PrpC
MTLSLRYSAATHVGRARRNKRNQDSGFASQHLLVVADGMGGGPAGDLASSVTVQALRRLDGPPPSDLLQALAGAVHRANDRLAELIEDDPSLDGMGSTATAALFDGERIGLAHIGDSRGYLLRAGELERLTCDHTFVQALIDEGRLSEEDARHHPHRSLILRVLDGRQANDPDLALHDLQPGDRLLLCSDGLAGVVSDEAIAEALAAGSPDSAAEALIELALRAGGPDNITCIVADVVSSGVPTTAAAGMLVVGAAADLARGHNGRHPLPPPLADTGELPPVNDPDPEELRYAPRPPRRFRWLRRLVYAAVVIGVLFVAARLAYDWSQRQYYVAAAGSQVAIYRGVQEQLPGLRLSTVFEAEQLPLSSLPVYARERVAGGIEVDGLTEARSTVAQLRGLAAECASPAPVVVPTVPTASGRTPAGGKPRHHRSKVRAGTPAVTATAGPTGAPTRSPTAEPTPTPTPAPARTKCVGVTPRQPR